MLKKTTQMIKVFNIRAKLRRLCLQKTGFLTLYS